ncbi:hypothetical protein QYF61_026701 [Mycteria americana]|uniref:Uncharacterized protein n=1 Tax=Mycteria americana TaxID=33587 RepID=A0AAN7NP85_MYCAM|nr:hypothetical protein QYF61_026701 [Mycteria americana]
MADSEWHMSQVCPVGKKANGILGCINSSAAHTLREMTIPLYSILIRPHRDYALSFGLPNKKPKISINWSKFSRRLMRWVVKHWNRLPREVVESPSLELFKRRVDVVLRDMV